MSSTISEGRHSLTPSSVTTNGRLIRIGWAIGGQSAADPPTGGVYPHVRDESLAERLWTKSEEMTGVRFSAT